MVVALQSQLGCPKRRAPTHYLAFRNLRLRFLQLQPPPPSVHLARAIVVPLRSGGAGGVGAGPAPDVMEPSSAEHSDGAERSNFRVSGSRVCLTLDSSSCSARAPSRKAYTHCVRFCSMHTPDVRPIERLGGPLRQLCRSARHSMWAMPRVPDSCCSRVASGLVYGRVQCR